jgi:hypothetical protein
VFELLAKAQIKELKNVTNTDEFVLAVTMQTKWLRLTETTAYAAIVSQSDTCPLAVGFNPRNTRKPIALFPVSQSDT